MPRLLVLRECQLPQEQIDRVSGKPLEGERPINKTGVPVQSSNKELQTFGSRLYQRHRPKADMAGVRLTPFQHASLQVRWFVLTLGGGK